MEGRNGRRLQNEHNVFDYKDIQCYVQLTEAQSLPSTATSPSAEEVPQLRPADLHKVYPENCSGESCIHDSSYVDQPLWGVDEELEGLLPSRIQLPE